MGLLDQSPPPDHMATAREWLSARLVGELDALLNLIYLARRNPNQCDEYLIMSEQVIDRIRLMAEKYRWFNAA
ncbi:MAG: hypothetical protein JOZ83_08405 [Silvibacterium sp.]|nr:hypothetical protein [Silvibacterium sp.]